MVEKFYVQALLEQRQELLREPQVREILTDKHYKKQLEK